MHLSLIFIMVTLSAAFLKPVSAQEIERSAIYVSETDQNLTLRKLAVLPVTDNLDGIYARPIESELIQLIQKDHHWEYVDSKLVGPLFSPTELENNPDQVRKVVQDLGADAVFASKVTKGPDGISIQLDLFLGKDGLLIAQEIATKITQFDIRELQSKTGELYQKILAKLPYQGLVLSRTGTRVTLNLGKRDGVTKDQIVNAVQIIKVNRHPRFKFIISTEKEILGKVKIQKVEETLSFGAIISEKDKGAIQKFSKIAGLDFVTYNDLPNMKGEDSDILDAPGNKLAFGKNPVEWRPVNPPTFGEVNLALGIGNYTGNLTVNSGGTPISLNGSKPMFLSIRLGAELWLTPKWNVLAELKQGVMSINNPRSGSSPSELNLSLSRYSFLIGYNFLLREDFFGPKIQLQGGFSKFSTFVDDSSPLTFVSSSYGGLMVGLRGSFPIDEDKIWEFGAGMQMVFSPSLVESPYSSGDSSTNSFTSYSLFGSKKVGQRLEVTGTLEFELYSSNFSGGGTRPGGEPGTSMSHRVTSALGGISYLF